MLTGWQVGQNKDESDSGVPQEWEKYGGEKM